MNTAVIINTITTTINDNKSNINAPFKSKTSSPHVTYRVPQAFSRFQNLKENVLPFPFHPGRSPTVAD